MISRLPRGVQMPKKQILIRDVPEDKWIEDARHAKQESQPTLFDFHFSATQPLSGSLPFTFIDLFAGIGGMRLGLQWAGGRCVFSCEWDTYCQKTYRAWFNETPRGDIREIKPDEIPDHDILAAGFPCQPFSIAGVSKKTVLDACMDSRTNRKAICSSTSRRLRL